MLSLFSERKNTFRQLDHVREQSYPLPLDVERDRFIVLSDVHMADRVPGVDEFEPNEVIYCHALQHYYDNNYRLILNGDIEECWEARPTAIVDAYRDTVYALERKFVEKGEGWHARIYGNHDGLWAHPAKVEKLLHPVLGPIKVHAAVTVGDEILIAHGHQGETNSDTYSWFSRYAVRHGWRWAQRFLRVSSSRAAINNFIRRRRDNYLYEWAKDRGMMLIAGHTHRGMFRSYGTADSLSPLLEMLDQQIPNNLSPQLAKATANYLRRSLGLNGQSRFKRNGRTPVERNPMPCYFNAGCCVHTNGITGLEIDRGEIRLVQWQMAGSEVPEVVLDPGDVSRLFRVERKVLQQDDLVTLLERIRTRQPHPYLAKEAVFNAPLSDAAREATNLVA
ncbi:hypothetical protein GF324_11490 [bacterium]|nr:hypothetical protein [bacterium]